MIEHLSLVRAASGGCFPYGQSTMSNSTIDTDKVRDPQGYGDFQDLGDGGSGLMAWLRASEVLRPRDFAQPVLLVERIGAFPSSGEIRRKVDDPLAVLARIKGLYAAQALEVDEAEGLGVVLTDWRFKLRILNSGPVIVLSVESRGDVALMQAKTLELLEQVAAG